MYSNLLIHTMPQSQLPSRLGQATNLDEQYRAYKLAIIGYDATPSHTSPRRFGKEKHAVTLYGQGPPSVLFGPEFFVRDQALESGHKADTPFEKRPEVYDPCIFPSV
ncbi:unnamed protein product [Sympodiomycopsis kandeliae]